ncbi:hypothetical protein [Endozoicomonas sp. Mp262]|uniref:hypothetical protein n=1 Tax=Endozoicomonas sp. Mp262 TaxID=2919499 RepID=UPI0021DA8027
MKSIKYISIATVMALLATPVSAADLKVYSNLFGSMANVVVWDGDQPVSEGTVVIKNQAGHTVASGDINESGRASLRMVNRSYGEYAVFAESGDRVGAGQLVIDDRNIGR